MSAPDGTERRPGAPGGLDRQGGQIRFADRLAYHYRGKLMFVYGIGWHFWDGTRWAFDDQGRAERAVLEILRAALAESLEDKDLRRDVERCETASGIKGILEIASVHTTFRRTATELDADPYLLNCANGTLDLQTLTMRPHDPADNITRVTRAAYRPDTESDEWTTFLERVLPDAEVRGYLQRLVGLALLGQVVEHIFTIATGTGANGKGTAYTAIVRALGDYARVAESDLFMAGQRADANRASPALFELRGRRFVVVSETERDHKLAMALVKNLTGGDPITARALYGKPITFDPSHTSLMVTNFLPRVSVDDPALWRRLRVIPFDVVIPEAERDPALPDRLVLAADAVLSWAVDGWQDYRARGMDAPAAVLQRTEEYHQKSDDVALFIAEECFTSPAASVPFGDLWARWERWVTVSGGERLSQKAFGAALDKLGIPAGQGTHGVRVRVGVRLYAESTDDDEG